MEPIVLNKIKIYPDRRRVEVEGERIDGLGYPGWDLLHALAQRAGKLVTRDMLFVSVYPDPEVRPTIGSRAVDSLACRVRKLLAEKAGGHNFIQAISGSGYVLVAPD